MTALQGLCPCLHALRTMLDTFCRMRCVTPGVMKLMQYCGTQGEHAHVLLALSEMTCQQVDCCSGRGREHICVRRCEQ